MLGSSEEDETLGEQAKHPHVRGNHTLGGEQGAVDYRAVARRHVVIGEQTLQAIQRCRAVHLDHGRGGADHDAAIAEPVQALFIQGDCGHHQATQGSWCG